MLTEKLEARDSYLLHMPNSYSLLFGVPGAGVFTKLRYICFRWEKFVVLKDCLRIVGEETNRCVQRLYLDEVNVIEV